ncbi:MAG TPA: SBBP repeat-containing protein [Flavipsychrobacter sp.]|nr:SBBP repeat-containing protein [Flavipsychrobacter sp.]
MKSLVLSLLISLLSFNALAQTSFLQWAKRTGGHAADYGNDMEIDAKGNIYIIGEFTDTVDFDPGPGIVNLISAGMTDVFIEKLDASGNLLWVKKIGGSAGDYGKAIALDTAGNVYTTGSFSATVDLDPGPAVQNFTSGGFGDIFIQKFDPNGNLVWVKAEGGTGEDFGSAIIVDSAANVCLTGAFRDTVDFNPGTGVIKLASAGGWDIFVQKLNSSGALVWIKTMGGFGFDIGNSIALDASGNVISTGYFSNTVDFDPSAFALNFTSNGLTDIYVQKLNSAGNHVWTRQMGGTGFDYGNSVCVDANGNIITVGDFSNSVDFDPGTSTQNFTSTGFSDVFVQKMNAAGILQWVKQLGGTGTDEAHSVDKDLSGNIYVAGQFSNTVDMDPGGANYHLSSFGGEDIFIERLDASGSFVWAQQIGGTSGDEVRDVAVHATGNVYATGYFTNTSDFDPGFNVFNLSSQANSADIFVEKLSQCDLDSSSTSVTRCDRYTWIDGNTYTSSDTVGYYVPRSGLCDSVVILRLTILHSPSTAVTQNGMVLTSAATGATYQWLDCNNNFMPIPGATSATYTAIANGSYAVKVTSLANGCSDTSACIIPQATGLAYQGLENHITVYPDPTTDQATVHLGKTYKQVTLQLTDNLGRTLLQFQEKHTDMMKLRLAGYPSGLYFVTVSADGEKAVMKLMKE